MSTMAMSDADWSHVLGDFNLLLCPSTSPQPTAIATSGSRRSVDWSVSVSGARTSGFHSALQQQQARLLYASPDGGRFSTFISSSPSSFFVPHVRPEDYLPIAAAAPPGHGGAHRSCCKTQVLELEASSDAAFAAADCLSSALMNLQREDESFYMPMYSAPPPLAVVGDQYCSGQLPPLPADGALTSLDDALLLPFSDIDLEAFDNNAEEHKPPPVDQMIMIPPAVHHHHHPAAAASGTRAPPIHGTTVGQNAGVAVQAHPKKAMDAIESSCFPDGQWHDDDELRQAGSAVTLVLPRRRARRSGGGDRAPPAGKTRLDHIGFDDLRKYFYMPITRAAREMNVGLTVLKKRCRELGVARWPHRKMKSLKSLMANVQEMGNGMSPVAVQQELAALETYCALMEENPWIELTERTKKLRQACFKESYKRRRAAAVSVSVMEMDHIYSFGQQHQLPPPPTSSADDDDRHGQSQSQSQSSRFYGY